MAADALKLGPQTSSQAEFKDGPADVETLKDMMKELMAMNVDPATPSTPAYYQENKDKVCTVYV